MMPFFARNKAIVIDEPQTGVYRVSPFEGVPSVLVDTNVTFNGRALVTVRPTWHHTDDERQRVTELSRAAVEEMLKSTKGEVNAANC